MSTLVSIRNLHKTYQRGPEKVDVLKGIDIDIDQGDFVAMPHSPQRGQQVRA